VSQCHTNAKIPIRKHDGDAGFDLTIVETVKIPPMQSTTVSTGLKFRIPPGYYGQIFPRSSMAKTGLTIDGGVIDQSYTGECFIILVNRKPTGSLKLDKGSRVCQIIFLPILTTPL
jgi:dUTP pyrophosphatase